jgi:hypothetical protein
MGGDVKSGKWEYTGTKGWVPWCNGPANGRSPRAIKGLLEVGCFPGKLKYYRGGMRMRQL